MEKEKEGIFIRHGLTVPFSEVAFSYIRSPGPGGQKVNKTATKVRLKWWPLDSQALKDSLGDADRERLIRRACSETYEDGSVQVTAHQFRTREANREACCRKLADRIRSWLKKPKKRIPTKPTRTSKEKRLQEKKKRSQIKRDRKLPKGE